MRARNQLTSYWSNISTAWKRLGGSADMRPVTFSEVVRSQPGRQLAFAIEPVVFNLPERANNRQNDLFVVVRGTYEFDPDALENERKLLISRCGTQVGYFREKGGQLVHVYGAHYDFEPTAFGHPAYHAQINTFVDMATEITKRFSLSVSEPPVDHVEKLIRTVRIPTAQLDVFSTIVQLIADHLLYEDSGPEKRKAFSELLRHSAICQGSNVLVPHLAEGQEGRKDCFRAHWWYGPV